MYGVNTVSCKGKVSQMKEFETREEAVAEARRIAGWKRPPLFVNVWGPDHEEVWWAIRGRSFPHLIR